MNENANTHSQVTETLNLNENVEAFEMPSNLNDYSQHLSPEMVAQAHE
jgi:hypothetical protein